MQSALDAPEATDGSNASNAADGSNASNAADGSNAPNAADGSNAPNAAEATPVDGPLEATVSTTTSSGVTLVRVELQSTVDADLRVRIANGLDGPVLPPRPEGVPAAGWDAEGFRGVVPASGRLGVGYACPVSTSGARRSADHGTTRERTATAGESDAVSVELLGPADEAGAESASVEATIRSLGRARPPQDAVPIGAGARSPETTASDGTHGSTDETDAGPWATDATNTEPRAADAVPVAVDDWFDEVESRVGVADRLTDASAEEATAVLAARGGVDALSDLPEAVAADESALRAVAARADALADRAATTNAAPVVASLSAAANGDRPTTPTSRIGVDR
ncbi:hypothetical protein [Halobellus litoreus]|uniref:DUF8080 domain-containing protein n=1 Tax=Halobellus litoreus TaxID=755310 RepID=A0ABD6DUE1_9EURY